jgi:hypothetical protein
LAVVGPVVTLLVVVATAQTPFFPQSLQLVAVLVVEK